ncbi:uncharacterized protein BDV14DRAFT_97792 [Aspergillus stella-maris]|uniref:uncharacterized protein n=1 Tax=Aspergillus stella-maris TaxID=1810926 RepID=UPI003CCD6635
MAIGNEVGLEPRVNFEHAKTTYSALRLAVRVQWTSLVKRLLRLWNDKTTYLLQSDSDNEDVMASLMDALNGNLVIFELLLKWPRYKERMDDPMRASVI